MIKINILYPHAPGARFDVDYYLNKHIPMVRDRLGAALKGVIVDIGTSGLPPTQPPLYVAQAYLVCDSLEAFLAAQKPHGREIQADIRNYTDITPVMQVSEVKIAE